MTETYQEVIVPWTAVTEIPKTISLELAQLPVTLGKKTTKELAEIESTYLEWDRKTSLSEKTI